MVDEDCRREVESSCKQLVRQGKNPVRAGQIAEAADIEDATRLGMLLSYGAFEFEEIEIEIIKHDDKGVSNQYRILY
jgi:hypothetical protein